MHSHWTTEQPGGLMAIWLSKRPTVPPLPVIVPGHDDDCLFASREVPEARQGLPIEVHVLDEVDQQPLLLVGLRDGDLVQVDPIREEQSSDRIGVKPSRSWPAQAGFPCLV